MDISILEIYYKDIREMKELTIDLCDFKPNAKTPKRISLIQMPNGVGKTTTMELIRYCLDGEAEKMDEKKILSFKPPASDVKNGEFRVKFNMKGEKERIVWVSIKFDYDNAKVYYMTSQTSEKGGMEKGLNLPLEIKPFMTKNFVRLFVFDGELAGDLLKSEKTSAEDAINSLYHLDKLKELYEKIDIVMAEKIGESGTQSDQGLKILNTKLKNALGTRTELESKENVLSEKFNEIEGKIKKIDEKIDAYRRENDELNKQYDELKKQKDKLDSIIQESTRDLLNKICLPYNLSDKTYTKLKELSTQMHKLKLPKTQSTEFFEELANSPECLCGREIGVKEAKIIREKSKEYLTEDEVGVINSIKTSIRNLPKREELEPIIENIKKCKKDKQLKEQAIIKLDQKSDEKEKIDALKTKKIKLQTEEEKINSELRELTEKNKIEQESLGLTPQNNIELCEEQIKFLQDKISKATNTVGFKNRALFLKDMLEYINQKSLIKLKDNIVCKTNEKIEKILNSKDIKISKISTYLSLYEKSGVSEGQKLSIAYAFLSTLFSQSPHNLPFVVDTPAAPLDLSVRRQVAEIIPDLFKQIVIFITSGERNGFVDKFYSERDKCQFLTIRRDRETGVKLERDLSFFENFQSEDE